MDDSPPLHPRLNPELRRAPRKPTLRFMPSHPAHAIAFGFGSGLSPIAPGTVGTMWAWFSFLVLQRHALAWRVERVAAGLRERGWMAKVAACWLMASVDVGRPGPVQAEKPLSSTLTARPGPAVVKAINARSMLAQCAAWAPHNCFSRASRPQFNR